MSTDLVSNCCGSRAVPVGLGYRCNRCGSNCYVVPVIPSISVLSAEPGQAELAAAVAKCGECGRLLHRSSGRFSCAVPRCPLFIREQLELA